jgi:hypothetical protein
MKPATTNSERGKNKMEERENNKGERRKPSTIMYLQT